VIPAQKSGWFTRWFVGDAETRIFRAFGAVKVRGLEGLACIARDSPVLVVSNHTAWWDPLVVLYVCVRVLRLDAYAMMDAKNLRRLPFFGKVGAFGVDLDDAADGARAIRYAARLLDRPGRLVWIFAQGRELPVTARPLVFRPGSAEIARVASVVVIPAALRYEHGSRPEPMIYLALGEPLDPDRDVVRARTAHEAAVTRELDRIDRALVSGDTSDLTALYEKRPARMMAFAQAALSWLTRVCMK
jgi:1-acyl-sn-glycerol-3-phosphate acyltransferase